MSLTNDILRRILLLFWLEAKQHENRSLPLLHSPSDLQKSRIPTSGGGPVCLWNCRLTLSAEPFLCLWPADRNPQKASHSAKRLFNSVSVAKHKRVGGWYVVVPPETSGHSLQLQRLWVGNLGTWPQTASLQRAVLWHHQNAYWTYKSMSLWVLVITYVWHTIMKSKPVPSSPE